MRSDSSPRIFYGYYLVAVTFVFLTLFNGSAVSVFSLFVRPLEDSQGWGRGEVMAGFTFFYLLLGFTSPVVGRFVDRYGARPVIPIGAVTMGLAFLLLSHASELWMFYLGYVIAGIGAAGMGPVPCSAVISNWFRRRRGMTLGLMAAGIGAGGVVMAPFVSFMLARFDWRTAYLSMAILIVAVVVPLSLRLIRTRPAEMGLNPDGDRAPAVRLEETAKKNVEVAGLTLRQAARTSAFWLIAVAFSFSNFANMSVFQASSSYLADAGFSIATAATSLGLVGFGSATGKILFGWLCDRMPANRVCAIGIALQLAGTILLISVHEGSSTLLVWGYALLLGFGVGAWLPTLSMLSSINFGLLFYGTVFGSLNLMNSTGTATGPLFSGLAFDMTGSYMGAFVACAVLMVIAIPAALMARKPSRPSRSST
jgi:sugar phosphate permease